MGKVTRRGARNLTRIMDRVADAVQEHAAALGLDPRIATDFVWRNDFVAQMVEKNAGLTRELKANFDAESIGKEVAGPDEQDPDEPYMNGEFTQQENRELRERQEDGDLGADPVDEPMKPTPGVQASFKSLISSLKKVNPKSTHAKRVALALELARKVAEEDGDEDQDEEAEADSDKEAGIKLNA